MWAIWQCGRRYAGTFVMLIMKIRLIRFLAFAALLILSTSRSAAQPETDYSYWAGAGLGPLEMSDLSKTAFGGSGRIAFAWSQSVISLSAGGGGTMEIFGTNDDVTVLNVCYGRLAYIDSWLLRFSAGPAYLNRTRRTSSLFSGSSTQLDISEFGACAEAEVMFRYKLLGLGLVVSGAITENASVVLLTFNASLGSWHR